VRVLVADENDNAPEFMSESVPDQIRLDAGVNLGQVLAQLRARDPDQGDNGRVRFVLVDDRSRALLDLDPDSGELRFARLALLILYNLISIFLIYIFIIFNFNN
jgi:hypothetical protein